MVTKKEFPNRHVFQTEIGGRPFTVITGQVAELCNGECICRYGDTVVLTTVVASSAPKSGIDYFPLTIDFEERMYSVGRIPGAYLRREGRPSERGVLVSRLIDRPMRPFFDDDLRNDVVVTCTSLSNDKDNSIEVVASLGAFIATAYSDVPWNGPMATTQVAYVDGEYVVNPSYDQHQRADMFVTIASTAEKVVMIETEANEIPEDILLGGIKLAHETNQKIVAFINEIVAEIGKPKFSFEKAAVNYDLLNDLMEYGLPQIEYALDTDDKNVREERLAAIRLDFAEKFKDKYEDYDQHIEVCLYKMQKKVVKKWLMAGKRVDGRRTDEIRPLAAEVGVLPRVHGSGLFTRGQTQVLSVCTLASLSMMQKLDTIFPEESKRWMHHYNMPAYSTGEARGSRSTSRREYGHGALVEKALAPVLPSVEEFPYAIRVVSDVLSSNGSTSQGSICGSTLSLMAAGVPIKAPVAGISCGLITGDDGVYGDFMTMIDIQGLEDFYGDMDFKVAGTKKGITAIQMDLKVHGLTPEIIKEAFAKTHKARNYILDEIMLPVIGEPRKQLSPYAPKMLTLQIDPDKIGDVIGKGGKVIQEIQNTYDVKINIEEDGRVFISGIDMDKCNGAVEVVKLIATDPEVGAFYNGVVTRLMSFGAFVEIAPGKEGLVHISRLDVKRTEHVEDVVNVGDSVVVKCIEIDDQGRINLSRRDALIELEGMTPENEIDDTPRRPRRDDHRGHDRDRRDRRPRR